MKGLSTIILAAFLCISMNSFAEEQEVPVYNSFGYFAFGTGFPFPAALTIGHRTQHHRHGYEFGIGGSSVILLSEAHLYGSYLHYFKPNLESQSYIGLEVRAGGWMFIEAKYKGLYAIPALIIGREKVNRYNRRTFIEVRTIGFATQINFGRVF